MQKRKVALLLLVACNKGIGKQDKSEIKAGLQRSLTAVCIIRHKMNNITAFEIDCSNAVETIFKPMRKVSHYRLIANFSWTKLCLGLRRKSPVVNKRLST
ncbi:hypothetical protein TSAR_010150 [Trichomalopsis sarcophagae]|uniref:Uncharacterized protein n=1 Tax=Trichomalopsis sarcophagae TaxID=543379 RepID=A0A232F939_9HYME|nr:hypothetical protein TSAR_010150 [Trichomalopsis sarcophagae]